MTVTEDIVYSENGLTLDIYKPRCEHFPVYIFFHGGGLVSGNSKVGENFSKALTENGIALVSVNYRMYPEARFPDYINDAAKAVAFVLKKSDIRKNITYVTVGGSSAGGYISQMLFFDPEFLKNAGVDRNSISGWFFNAGQPTSHFNYLKFEKGLDGRCIVIDEAAPLYYLREDFDFTKAPYIKISAADNDMVNRREQNEMLYTAMLHFGFPKDRIDIKVYENCTHCGYAKTKPEEYFNDICTFVKKAGEI